MHMVKTFVGIVFLSNFLCCNNDFFFYIQVISLVKLLLTTNVVLNTPLNNSSSRKLGMGKLKKKKKNIESDWPSILNKMGETKPKLGVSFLYR